MKIETVRNTDGGYVVNNQFFIPKDEENFDYQDIKTWVNAGNIIEPEAILVEDTTEKDLENERLKRKVELENFLKNHKIVISHNDGSCSVLDTLPGMLDEKFVVKEKLFSEEYRMVGISNLPKELPEAWTDDFNTETVDIHNEKARQVLLQQIRNLRLPKLAKLDIDSLRALEDGDSKRLEDIKQKKQFLRDITDPLKNSVIKKFNCPEILEKLKELSKIQISKF